MGLKSNKGYSLIEIGVGILILTVFLIVSLGMFNGAYNNYRRIKQRNIAVNTAVTQIENMLQMDTNELTGFYTQEEDFVTHKYELKPCSLLKEFVQDKYNPDDVEDYISKNTTKCINAYIKNVIQNGEEKPTEEELANGEYGFIVDGYDSNQFVTEIYNGPIKPSADGREYVVSNNQAIKIIKTVTRLPATKEVAYGNEVLKLRVEVFYSEKFGNNIKEEDLKSVVLETIKITK